ncbi:MAG: adenine phosphoribosyltransferase [Deltaproteobacteria bacterium]|nr:adenine phosphoribosyltransferase [Deltaproteobacteria bacterium]
MDPRLDLVRRSIRDVPDFPKPGILFKDITPLLSDAEAFEATLALLEADARRQRTEVVLGIESRGFIFGAALASRLGVGFVPARKPGKLPAAVDREAYSLEYGKDALEVHQKSFRAGQRALVVDDVIATGGTARAAVALCRRQGAEVVGVSFVIELSFLEGRKALPGDIPIHALLTY